MTIGIIQKVFTNHLEKHRGKPVYNISRNLNELQEELIAEIKKNLMGEEKDDYVIHRDLVLNILIGDNQ